MFAREYSDRKREPEMMMPSIANGRAKGRVLYVGQCYYNAWYISLELKKLGWKTDVLNWDPSEKNEMYYHGEDFKFRYKGPYDLARHLRFYAKSLFNYDIFHFSNAHGMRFGDWIHFLFRQVFPEYSEVRLLKALGKKIVYTNNGCMDGVSQTSFRKWGPHCSCDICVWHNVPKMCSDEKNLRWGRIRNSLADYQITLGANRVDCNDDPKVHEVPQFYCLDQNFWSPDMIIPVNYRLWYPEGTVRIYHSVGNFEMRTHGTARKNIKCTHIYLPVIEKLKSEGYNVELMFVHDVPNRNVRYYQAQADIVADMLTFGWFGANAREAMMLGKPVVCFIRPEWLESMRKEIPDYVNELPLVIATPETVYSVLKDLIKHPDKRRDIGRKSREFAVKWHSAEAGARRLDEIYSSLLGRMSG
jgi:glycosyltransferase involved in cell wall biosynthesis